MKLSIIWPKLRKSTIAYLTLLAAGSLADQVSWVNRHLAPLVANHPRLAPLGGALLTGLALLHNPEVSGILRQFGQMIRVVKPDGTVISSVSIAQETSTREAVDVLKKLPVGNKGEAAGESGAILYAKATPIFHGDKITMNFLSIFSLLSTLAKPVVLLIQSIHGEAVSGATKAQMAKTALVGAVATSGLVLNQSDEALAQLVGNTASTLIDQAVTNTQATGEYQTATAGSSGDGIPLATTANKAVVGIDG